MRSNDEDRGERIDIEMATGADRHPATKRPVMDIEGIGPAYAARLDALGIRTIGQLLKATPNDVADFCAVPVTMVRNWRDMGRLIDVKGVGPQFAELLVRSGIHSVEDLAEQEPAELLTTVQQTEAEREHRIQGAHLGLRVVESWIAAGRQYVGGFGSPFPT